MGNKTAIQKQRRGLPEESGCYQYSYDKLQRLIGVEKDGKHIRSYQYDTFSNRIEMEDNTKGIKNIYQYNALNQLIEQKIWETPDITSKINTFINGNDIDNIKHNNNTNILHKTFTYDKRGNLTGEYQEDALLHGYHFNRMNRLEKAWNHQGEEAQYFYNALGQRTGRTANGEREDYLLDLTKPYHNLLELQKGKQTQTFFWDFNAAVMEDEKRNLQYYLQDDLGSPLRVLYRNGYGEAYGYNEFGTELYESEPRKEEKTRKKYGKQGENQPFGYTGYRYDNISGSYFAQAREYMPEVGRFVSEDTYWNTENSIYKDNVDISQEPIINVIRQSTNRYEYCISNPIRYIDLYGMDAGDTFKSADSAAEDFAETTNGKSIEEDVEYGAFIYSWEEDVKILWFNTKKTRYSYTEPATQGLSGNAVLDVSKADIPDGTVVVAGAHTHGAFKWGNIKSELDAIKANDNFSDIDEEWAKINGMPLYLVAPIGILKKIDLEAKKKKHQDGATFKVDRLSANWDFPHDRNHPSLPKKHKKDCEKCYTVLWCQSIE